MDIQREENTHLSTKWIEGLALDEINMEETGMVNFDDHVDPHVNLEFESIELMEKIREKFELFVNIFNHYRDTDSISSRNIKIFKISNTVNDFMLFRNSLKLVITRPSSDTISLGFVSNSSGFYAARTFEQGQVQSNQGVHEIHAKLGAFNKIKWHFQGEEIEIDSLVKYYLTEFIKQSAS